jgi:hypothetical protein
MDSARVPVLLVAAIMLLGAAMDDDSYGLVAVGVYMLGLWTGLELVRFVERRNYKKDDES